MRQAPAGAEAVAMACSRQRARGRHGPGWGHPRPACAHGGCRPARGSVPTPRVQMEQLGQQLPMCPCLFPTVRRRGQTVEAEQAPRH